MFSVWLKWTNREQNKNIKYPGIYIICHSEVDIEGSPFEWNENIIYIGMTNSKQGLRGRLKQFDNTLRGKSGHGGASRVIFKYKENLTLVENLYVAVQYFECDVKSKQVEDLLVMGGVASYEYVCFAEYVKRYNRLPEFNDMEKSPKK